MYTIVVGLWISINTIRLNWFPAQQIFMVNLSLHVFRQFSKMFMKIDQNNENENCWIIIAQSSLLTKWEWMKTYVKCSLKKQSDPEAIRFNRFNFFFGENVHLSNKKVALYIITTTSKLQTHQTTDFIRKHSSEEKYQKKNINSRKVSRFVRGYMQFRNKAKKKTTEKKKYQRTRQVDEHWRIRELLTHQRFEI